MQRGFAPVLILVGMLIIALVAGGAYYLGRQTYQQPTPVPVVSQPPQPTTLQPSPSPTPPYSLTINPDTGWQKYKYISLEDNYSFEFPPNWKVLYWGHDPHIVDQLDSSSQKT